MSSFLKFQGNEIIFSNLNSYCSMNSASNQRCSSYGTNKACSGGLSTFYDELENCKQDNASQEVG